MNFLKKPKEKEVPAEERMERTLTRADIGAEVQDLLVQPEQRTRGDFAVAFGPGPGSRLLSS